MSIEMSTLLEDIAELFQLIVDNHKDKNWEQMQENALTLAEALKEFYEYQGPEGDVENPSSGYGVN